VYDGLDDGVKLALPTIKIRDENGAFFSEKPP